MSLRLRLALGILAISLVLLTPLGLALLSLKRLDDSVALLRNQEFEASLLLSRMRAKTDDLANSEAALVFLHNTESRDRMSRDLADLGAMADSLDRYALDSVATKIHAAVAELTALAPREYATALAGLTVIVDSISTNAACKPWLTATSHTRWESAPLAATSSDSSPRAIR